MTKHNTTPDASASRHTPEPWAVYYQPPCPLRHEMRAIVQANAKPSYRDAIVQIVWQGGAREQDAANAARIVSCVNFAAGIPNEKLTPENGAAVREMLLAGMNPEAVKGVVSALEVCLSRLDHTAKVQGLTLYANNERDHARAALAALKGSK